MVYLATLIATRSTALVAGVVAVAECLASPAGSNAVFQRHHRPYS